MPLDVFNLRESVVGSYREYFESFVRVRDARLDTFVRGQLAKGEPWPDAYLQLNPSFVRDETLGELAASGEIHTDTARFFGADFRLYRHQREALTAAAAGHNYVVTTGTGSGKSWTYLIPLVDHIFRAGASDHSVRAIIVYPMNALINSQRDALTRLRDDNWPDAPIRFGRYTGQEKDTEKNEILDDPPHILLTNYVMLEYMLVRPHERSKLLSATRNLEFIVVDEMHFYRGRQGSDVAMLLRRIAREATKDDSSRRLQFIGTSATIATESSQSTRNETVANVATTLFGVTVNPEHVIGETLEPIASGAAPTGHDQLAAAVLAPAPEATLASVRSHPLAAWVEGCFGLKTGADGLERQSPTTFNEGVQRLSEESGQTPESCEQSLRNLLEIGGQVKLDSNDSVFAFRLHQFLASGRTIYAPIEPADIREPTVTAGYWALGDEGERKLLYPLAFCRECGQEYYMCVLDDAGTALTPANDSFSGFGEDGSGKTGYFALDREGLWDPENDLPDSWFDFLKSGQRLKRSYKDNAPMPLSVRPDGRTAAPTPHDHEAEADAGATGWFQPRPFLVCLNCHTVYEKKQTDFVKLTSLSQTGRSTATTITTAATTMHMARQGAEAESCKLLSFTDNRQDASLQAGHLNDFVQVVLLRGALAHAVRDKSELQMHELGPAAFDALSLEPADFMQTPVAEGPGRMSAETAMKQLLGYRAIEDLRRAWRVAQPNLEQTGLLQIKYAGLDELVEMDSLWSAVPGFAGATPSDRRRVLHAFLDHLRSLLAIDAPALEDAGISKTVAGANNWLRDPWTVDSTEKLHRGAVALLPNPEIDAPYGQEYVRLGPTSAVGMYLRDGATWNRAERFSTDDGRSMVMGIASALKGQLLRPATHKGQEYGFQLIGDTLRWCAGTGKAPAIDPVRMRRSHARRGEEISVVPNTYFADLYGSTASELRRLHGREHTAQVTADRRIEREELFRNGKLPALFCSPTMELGIDIADLSVVHMRNVPRSPANYAQRGGRAGRGGRQALVMTFCSQGSAHDEHYFKNRTEMIAGAVKPARMDLANRELVGAHFHALWLTHVGAGLDHSISAFVNMEDDALPLHAEFAEKLKISPARLEAVKDAFRQIAGRDSVITRSEWYSELWLENMASQAHQRFDESLSRWRELFKGAQRDLQAARKVIDRSTMGARMDKSELTAAESRQQEVLREIQLLLNNPNGNEDRESDFYPYRYFAAEGFLPGYNFAPQPLRAIIGLGSDVETITRPRFLALREFGPNNIIYHEGQKNRVTWCLPTGDSLERRILSAKICNACGYIYPREKSTAVDICGSCGTELKGEDYRYPQRLLNQPTVRTRRTQRINSTEEERMRNGYDISTHYAFASDRTPRRKRVAADDGSTLIEVTYASGANVWQINNGLRRGDAPGFSLHMDTGQWRKPKDDDEDDAEAVAGGTFLSDVRPCVEDTRNIMLLSVRSLSAPDGHRMLKADAPLRTLLYALDLGIRLEYQVEENEVMPLLVGSEGKERILLWEAAEGGTGVWEQVMNDPAAFAKIARQALVACHFDPDTGEALTDIDAARCTAACYDCLLSYTNQRDHRALDRHLIRDYLLALAGSVSTEVTAGRPYEEQYRWLVERTDPHSELERNFLAFLYQHHLKLPDVAQRQVEGAYTQPDFCYERGGLPETCIFVDGSLHDDPAQAKRDREVRLALENRGNPVIAVRAGEFASTVAAYSDVFGIMSSTT